jgi:hypothetical protein
MTGGAVVFARGACEVAFMRLTGWPGLAGTASTVATWTDAGKGAGAGGGNAIENPGES